MAALAITITADDVLYGYPCDAERCMVALAIRRVFGVPVVVNRGYAQILNMKIPFPGRLTEAIDMFDEIGPEAFPDSMMPLTFDLEVTEVPA